MTRKFFNIQFADLNYDKQQSILEVLKAIKLKEAQAEGERYLKFKWHKPEPKTWQEAYIRSYGIDTIMWAGYENGKEERPIDDDWNFWLDEHLEETAEVQAKRYFNKTEIEVDI